MNQPGVTSLPTSWSDAAQLMVLRIGSGTNGCRRFPGLEIGILVAAPALR